MTGWRFVASMSARVLGYALADPRRVIAGLVHPQKAALYLRLLRLPLRLRSMVKTGPQFFQLVTGRDRSQLEDYRVELEGSTFYRTLSDNLRELDRAEREQPEPDRARMSAGYLDSHGSEDAGIYLYSIVRALRPQAVVETGVANGESSTIILQALEANDSGQLYSIDLLPPQPNPSLANSVDLYLPRGRGIGWLVPEELRGRWQLLTGDAREVLPRLLMDLGHIDMFLHDSHHSYEHMLFEYEVAWSHLNPGGVLLSDDCACPAFDEFQRRTAAQGAVYGTLGALLKLPAGRARAIKGRRGRLKSSQGSGRSG